MIDPAKLENAKQRGGRTIARCPACAECGDDKSGDHLFITAEGKFGCVIYPGNEGVEHRKRIHALAGVSSLFTPAPYRSPSITTPRPSSRPTPSLPPLRAPTNNELRLIARGRGWTAIDGMEVLVERGLLFTGEIYDAGTTHAAWVVTDPSRANAQARKFDRGLWAGIVAKAKSLPGTTASRCIGASIIGYRPTVWLVEGTPDLVAAPIVAHLAGLNLDDMAFVCITGAGNSLHADDLPYFIGKHVVIAVHSDGAGGKAAERWAEQLYGIDAKCVEGFSFDQGVEDLAEHLVKLHH